MTQDWPMPDLERRTARWADALKNREPGACRFELVAESGSELVGFIGGMRARREIVGVPAEVTVIHVLPGHRGTGVGGALWTSACERLRGETLEGLYVDTLAELRCCSFYEAHGGGLVERSSVDFYGATRTHVTYVWLRGVSHARC